MTVSRAIEKIFIPSTGVDIVFNINSLTPYSRSSIIYDVEYKKEIIIIAQPQIPFSKNTAYEDLHLTTLIQEKGKKVRFGIKCSKFILLDQYSLANNTIVKALSLKYHPPVMETSIRSAFRLSLSKNYLIKCKIVYKDIEYLSPNQFSIKDISLGGISIIIPKAKQNEQEALSQLKPNEEIILDIVLIDTDKEKPLGKFPILTQVKRINSRYSEAHTLIGFKILNLSRQDEGVLNKFIHDAQMDELKRLGGNN